MSCDCNCHYGSNEENCKNCNCNKLPKFPCFETVCSNCTTINRYPLPIPKEDSHVNLICSDCENILMTIYGKKHEMSIWINKNEQND